MSTDASNRDLGEISTYWPDVFQSHGPESVEMRRVAQERLFHRYHDAIKRYVHAAVDDPLEAEELFQNFALRFVRGDFHHANPSLGRFRDYLKSALFHLVHDYHRGRRRFPIALPENFPEPWVDAPPSADQDAQFLTIWRNDLLERAWVSLEEFERRTGRPLASLLRYLLDHPGVTSGTVAEMYSTRYGTSIRASWVRKTRMRAREKIQDFIVDEVERTLKNPSLEDIEEELVDLGWQTYCADAMKRRRGG